MRKTTRLVATFLPDPDMRVHRVARGYKQCTVGMLRYDDPLQAAAAKAAGDHARDIVRQYNRVDYLGQCEKP